MMSSHPTDHHHNIPINSSTSTTPVKDSPLQKVLRKSINKKNKHKFVTTVEQGNFVIRPQRPRRMHFIEYQNRVFRKPGPYPFPSNLASPTDLCVTKRFLKGKWVPTNMDFLAAIDPDPDINPDLLLGSNNVYAPILGVPKGLELLALTDHFYVQQVPRRDLPQAISTQLGSRVTNRYQVICGDTRNRIYYGVAKYPTCTGLLAGYRPFRLFIMNHNLEIMMNFDKAISCRLFWCFGGYGTKITVTGSEGELYGTLIQRFHPLRPNFDILDANHKRILFIKGPPIIPFPLTCLSYFSKFKLYECIGSLKLSDLDPVGVYLESAYGTGTHNVKNCLRIGFPRSLPFQIKCVILASLFQLYFTYYELGDEYQSGSFFKQQLRPLLRMNPFAATKVIRPYGYVTGKCNPYCTTLIVLIFSVIAVLVFYLLLKDHWNFSILAVDYHETGTKQQQDVNDTGTI